MSAKVNQIDQMAAVMEMTPNAALFKVHIRQITESPAFRGSRRSQEFLQFIVERALDGRFDELKERALGVELFGREPAYDTGEDSIVRVTACDVRKRLTQFYSDSGHDAGVRVELHPGSYIPDFHNAPLLSEPEELPTLPSLPPAQPRSQWLTWVFLGLLTLGLTVDLVEHFRGQRQSVSAHIVPPQILPWSALSLPNRQIRVILCDPDIVSLQRLLNYSVSLSDYANQHYWPTPIKPEALPVMQVISFRGANVAAVDVGIALSIAKKLTVTTQTARSVRLADFKTDDSFILLGSPRSNPWTELFQDQLDFNFKFDLTRKSEYILNKHPHAGESSAYVPTTEGWGTGEAYALVALVGNPNQAGQVLLIGGSTAEATEAAGKLTANPEQFSGILKSHGINPLGSPGHFEILLRVSTMAGSSNTFDVVAVHSLS
ncbi:MAG TPA: hypothetical protein VGG97_08675 [Bryobacteraceae bacterium]|jgi:hypothetical protein